MKKLIILLFISFVSCNQDNKDEVVKDEVIKEINSSQIPAVVMGKIYKYIRAMINNPHPKGTKKYKKWNKVILILLFIGVVLGFVIKSIKNIYY